MSGWMGKTGWMREHQLRERVSSKKFISCKTHHRINFLEENRNFLIPLGVVKL